MFFYGDDFDFDEMMTDATLVLELELLINLMQ